MEWSIKAIKQNKCGK